VGYKQGYTNNEDRFKKAKHNHTDDCADPGFVEGYVDGGERDVKPFNPNNYVIADPGFVEGYVDGGERDVKPFDPNNYVIEEIIIPPPSGTGGILYVQYVQSVNVTIADGDIFTPETFSFAPLNTSDMYITINGVALYPANGQPELATSAFYVTDSTGNIIRPKGAYQINDVFRWNGSIANWQMEVDDEIKIIYEI
jgi:hypothetical protein